MGGKHKQAQRIKNNARPSSSVRSAELLASSSQVPQFSNKEIRFIPPTLSLMKMEEFDSSISPAFQIVFKKMNKKDATTKLKALQEFSDLITETEPEAVKAILTFWATLYTILATDTDHRIREAVHNAHHHIILKDKKIVAPYLKQLIGAWFTSQYDNYPPAATAASKAFTAAFPPNKVQDCVLYCQKEILTYIQDNLTTKLDTNPKHGTTNEDAEAKYERVTVSSLQGYCLYLNTLTEEQIQKGTELNREIISNTKFVKLGTHKTAMIRATWFKVLATLYHKAPFLLSELLHAQVVPVVFNNLDESEPAVVGFVWEAALLIMDLGQEWWKHIHVEKTYLSKLKKVLREGGQGNAAVIYPNLLSFLHKLPPSVRVDQFYDSFFENLRLGLKRKTVTVSKSESTAVITALVECLQYAILMNHHSNVELCEKLIKIHLVPLIEWSLHGDQVPYRTIFHQVALLVQYWNRNGRSMENYPKFLQLFWTSTVQMFHSVHHQQMEDVNLAERHIVFLQQLKTPAKSREQLKVKFTTTTKDLQEQPDQEEIQVPQQMDEYYYNNLQHLVYTVVKNYITLIQDNKLLKNLTHNLLAVIQLFESEQFLLGLSKYLSTEQSDNLIHIYNKLLYQWLQSPDLRSERVVDLTFILIKYLKEKDKESVLGSFLHFHDQEDTFSWCIKNAFSHPYNQDPVIQTWLRNDRVSEFLIATTETNLKFDCPTNLKTLFKLAFSETRDGDLLIDRSTVSGIIMKLLRPLLRPQDFPTSIDSCARLACYVSQIIYTESHQLKCGGDDLILALFQFSTLDHADLDNLSEDTKWEINTSWQDALTILGKCLSKDDVMRLTRKFADLVEEMFLKNAPTQSDINRLIEMICNYIKAIFHSQPLMITNVYKLFLQRHFLTNWTSEISQLCLRAEYLNGNYTTPCPFIELQQEQVSENCILKYFVWGFVKISVLSTLLYDDDDDDQDPSESKEIIYMVDDSSVLMLETLHDLAMGVSFLNHYKMVKHVLQMSHYYNQTKIKYRQVLEKLQLHNQVQEVLQTKTTSWLWCRASYLLNEEIKPTCLEDVYTHHLQHTSSDLNKLHLVQIFGPHLNYDRVESSSDHFIRDVVILRSLLHCPEIDVQIAEVFEKIKKLRSRNIPRFLFEEKNLNWEEGEEVIQTVRLFSKLIETKFECLNRQHWDFGVISLSSWAASCYKFRTNHHQLQFQSFICAVIELYVNIDRKMMEMCNVKSNNPFRDEWEDLFLPNVHTDLVQLWLYLAEEFTTKDKQLSLNQHAFLQYTGKLLDNFHHRLIFIKDTSLPHWSKIIKRCCNLLLNSSTILQLWAYKMLLVMVPGLIEIDLQANSSNTPNTKGLTFENFKEVLLHTHNIVNDLLTGFKLGEDSCQVTSFTDSYTYVFAYLLLWCILLKLCEQSSPELRYQYAESLRNENLLKSLLNNLFKLMPTEILHYNEGKGGKVLLKLFQKKPSLDFNEPCTSENLEQLVCWVYAFSLAQLPALVRQWWSETESKVTQIVERVTAFYVSPQLCNQELLDVAHHETKFKNMTVKTIQSIREVVAIYTVDEAQMELVITLPQNYPLGGPDVRCNRQIGGTLHKQWLMQLKKCLLHQNGRIWDGLSLWNSNLDKKFDGVEECYICFAVLHPGTYQLPRLSCQTCKKKFHSPCLYKWFSTSNKSSCPICRNLF